MVDETAERLGRCDPHVHTTYSDGLGTPREIVEAALALGLDVIAITDHDSVQGALEARELAARHPPLPGRPAEDFRRALLHRTPIARVSETPLARVPLRDYARQAGHAIILNPAQKVLRKVRAARR